MKLTVEWNSYLPGLVIIFPYFLSQKPKRITSLNGITIQNSILVSCVSKATVF